MSRNEKKLRDKLEDEIKLAGLETLVPEELEKHVILNSNRLRTFEDARLEIVTFVEAKFRLRIRDSKPRDTVTRHAKATRSIHLERANRASHGPRGRAKERVRN